jgi:hypothetical protein
VKASRRPDRSPDSPIRDARIADFGSAIALSPCFTASFYAAVARKSSGGTLAEKGLRKSVAARSNFLPGRATNAVTGT